MTNYEVAVELTRQGFSVFPLKQDGKPYTENGFKDAVSNEEDLAAIWRNDALIGVYTGASGIIVLDLDMKVSDDGEVLVDGFTSLDEAWLDVPETFAYDSRNGLGRHLVYWAPEGKNLPRAMGYRGMKGVDRCSGNGYVVWMGGVPAPGEIAEAPEWLLDEKAERKIHEYDGTLRDWFEELTPGPPNALVRKAMSRAEERFRSLGNDFSHSDMIEFQYEAVRLGAEGNPGIPEYLEWLEDLFLSREGAHSRPEDLWESEWQEGLLSGIEKYGGVTELYKNLPKYNISIVPASIPDSLVTTPNGKPGFSRLLGLLVKETSNDMRILSILWNCPATSELARDWGLEFCYKRIQEARVKPEPTRENPRIEEQREAEKQGKSEDLKLLTDEERELIKSRPCFVNVVEDVARGFGWTQLAYFRAIAWATQALAFSFKGFVPLKGTQKIDLNLWMITLGHSGTGKTTALHFRNEILKKVFAGDPQDVPYYDLGTDSSPQGIHLALLERDGRPSFFGTDEASGFFKTLGKRDWDSGLEDTLSMYYNGFVPPSNKLNLKEMKGKSARTAFTQQMFATPDRLTETLSRDQFKSGFLARYVWSHGHPPVDSDDRFELSQSEELDTYDESPEAVQMLSGDLITAAAVFGDEPVALRGSREVLERLSLAYRDMYRKSESRDNWDIVEPSITRLMESMLKAAGICAMYRGDTSITMVDALHAIGAAEEWLENLHIVTSMISAGDWQRTCDEIEDWVRQRGGSVSKAQILNKFRSRITRDGRELDNYLDFLVESGIFNRVEANRGGIKYEINGAV